MERTTSFEHVVLQGESVALAGVLPEIGSYFFEAKGATSCFSVIISEMLAVPDYFLLCPSPAIQF